MRKNIPVIEFTADIGAEGMSCGDFLRSRGVSRRFISKAKRLPDGITRCGELIRTIDTVRAGDTVTLRFEDKSFIIPNGELYAPVVYESEDIIVFDKPAGMPVHPSAGHRTDTLGNLFAALCPEAVFRPINRLDKDTSGLCAAAKNAYAAKLLSGSISKTYFAVTEGKPLPGRKDLPPWFKWYECGDGEYIIDAPIDRAEDDTVRRTVRQDGKAAVTRYTIIKETVNHCLLRIDLQTGRTHQIRVHFSSLGCPLAGDIFYGGHKGLYDRQALHCGEMRFTDPLNGKKISLFSSFEEDMKI